MPAMVTPILPRADTANAPKGAQRFGGLRRVVAVVAHQSTH